LLLSVSTSLAGFKDESKIDAKASGGSKAIRLERHTGGIARDRQLAHPFRKSRPVGAPAKILPEFSRIQQ